MDNSSRKLASLKWLSNPGCFCIKVLHPKVSIHSFGGSPEKSQSSSYMYIHAPSALGPLSVYIQ